jgi:hypothetical protein
MIPTTISPMALNVIYFLPVWLNFAAISLLSVFYAHALLDGYYEDLPWNIFLIVNLIFFALNVTIGCLMEDNRIQDHGDDIVYAVYIIYGVFLDGLTALIIGYFGYHFIYNNRSRKTWLLPRSVKQFAIVNWIIVICFLSRSIFVALLASNIIGSQGNSGTLYFNGKHNVTSITVFFFYVCTELIPNVSMIYLLWRSGSYPCKFTSFSKEQQKRYITKYYDGNLYYEGEDENIDSLYDEQDPMGHQSGELSTADSIGLDHEDEYGFTSEHDHLYIPDQISEDILANHPDNSFRRSLTNTSNHFRDFPIISTGGGGGGGGGSGGIYDPHLHLPPSYPPSTGTSGQYPAYFMDMIAKDGSLMNHTHSMLNMSSAAGNRPIAASYDDDGPIKIIYGESENNSNAVSIDGSHTSYDAYYGDITGNNSGKKKKKKSANDSWFGGVLGGIFGGSNTSNNNNKNQKKVPPSPQRSLPPHQRTSTDHYYYPPRLTHLASHKEYTFVHHTGGAGAGATAYQSSVTSTLSTGVRSHQSAESLLHATAGVTTNVSLSRNLSQTNLPNSTISKDFPTSVSISSLQPHNIHNNSNNNNTLVNPALYPPATTSPPRFSWSTGNQQVTAGDSS